MGDAKTDTTTTEVRDRFCRDLFENADWPVPQSRKEFDRWLATVRADAWDEAAVFHGADNPDPYNPYRVEARADSETPTGETPPM